MSGNNEKREQAQKLLRSFTDIDDRFLEEAMKEPEAVTGIYQNLARKKGFGPLEGMTLPTTVNLVFRCRYVSGKEVVSEEFLEVGWFTPDEAMRIIRYPYMKKAFEDAHRYSGKPHFVTFRKADRDIAFISDCMI